MISKYSIFAKVYDLLILKFLGYQIAADFFIKHLPFGNFESMQVLDAGCGTGLYSFAILKRFPNAKIVAFDSNEEMLNQMKEKIKKFGKENSVKVINADVLLPIPGINQQFDIIITGGVLEHVGIDDAIKNLSQHLKIGGYFLNAGVRNNFFGKTAGKFWGLKNLFSKNELVEIFERYGFALIRHMALPLKYFLARLAKEAYIFKKQ